jgi:hypothetical protein
MTGRKFPNLLELHGIKIIAVAKLQQFRRGRFRASRWRANLTYHEITICLEIYAQGNISGAFPLLKIIDPRQFSSVMG